jgi:hypothetical protein
MSRVFLVEWLGVSAYVDAESHAKAKRMAMCSARDAGLWRPGESLAGLRCRLAAYTPPDVAVEVAR